MQVCTSLRRENHASTPPLSFLQAGRLCCHPTNSVTALIVVRHTVQLSHVLKSNKPTTNKTCKESRGAWHGRLWQVLEKDTYNIMMQCSTNDNYVMNKYKYRLSLIDPHNYPGLLNQVPASAGVKAGMSRVSGGR